jgi:hypothetical protein
MILMLSQILHYVEPLPPEAQRLTVFSIGIAASAKEPDAS